MFHIILFPFSFSPEATFSLFLFVPFLELVLPCIKKHRMDSRGWIWFQTVAEKINVQDKNNFKKHCRKRSKGWSHKDIIDRVPVSKIICKMYSFGASAGWLLKCELLQGHKRAEQQQHLCFNMGLKHHPLLCRQLNLSDKAFVLHHKSFLWE